MVAVEFPELLLEGHDRLQVQDALHDVSEGGGKGDATVPRGAQDPVRVGLVELGLQIPRALLHRLLEVAQLGEHWTDGSHKHLLDPPLHVGREVPESNRLHVLGTQGLLLHLPKILSVHVFPELVEGLWGQGTISPPRQGERKPDEEFGQLTVAVNPFAHVVLREVVVVFVELVPNEDRSLEFRIYLATFLQCGHGRCICSLLNTQHHVVWVLHEAQY
mmetsp:Transcript_71761/g.222561  ORF Transcript_71761/g.222561 Transcript_71761/m.222561 type:complete len:218 (+) Transcript_71761:1389-2042(+)